MRPGSPRTGPAGGAVGALAHRPQGPKAGRKEGSRVGDNFIFIEKEEGGEEGWRSGRRAREAGERIWQGRRSPDATIPLRGEESYLDPIGLYPLQTRRKCCP